MIVEKLEEKLDFTNSEKQIAEYILKNPFDIIPLSATELGKRTYTSKASIFRLCKKLGVESYDTFKHQIELEMNERNRLQTLLKQEPFHKNSSLKDIINILPSFYDTAIHHTRLMMDTNEIKSIVEKLNYSEKIDIYGSGITSSCATTAMFKFLSIGKECSVHTTVNEHYILSVKNKNITAILLSFTGNNPGIVHVAKYLKKLGIYTIGIGGLQSDELKKICHSYIEIYQKNLVMSLEMMTPYLSMTYIFDVLFAALLVKNYDIHLQDAIEVMKLSNQK